MRDCNSDQGISNDAGQVNAARDTVDLHSYDLILVCSSGGKDSVSAMLWLLDTGFPADKIELHHQLVDGPDSTLMDWPVSKSYVDMLGRVLSTYGCGENFVK